MTNTTTYKLQTNFNRQSANIFGGIVKPSDFNTNFPKIQSENRSFIADRIVSDFKFDEECKRNIELRKLKTVNEIQKGGK